MTLIKGRRVLIAGFGREGRSVRSYLAEKYPEILIYAADNDPAKLAQLPSKRQLSGKNWLKNLDQFDTVVRSPGVSLDMLKKHYSGHVTSATNLFFANCPGRTIGVTGTKGKSTTSSLIYEILKAKYPDVRLAGNIGLPALNSLKNAGKKTIFVVELSSYQLEDIGYSPDIAVILPIFEEHLTYHDGFENYIKAKSQIVLHQKANNLAVYYGQNRFSTKIASGSLGIKIAYPAQTNNLASAWIDGGQIWTNGYNGPEKLISVSDLPTIGTANVENAAAAVVVGLYLGAEKDRISAALKNFKTLKHRLEPVGTYCGITFYNDSLATIPEATMHALEALTGKVDTLIAGGFDRKVSMEELGAVIARTNIRNLILFPVTGEYIEKAVKKADPDTVKKFIPVAAMKEAVETAYKITAKNKICLLSPAAASFNLFQDYADRGEQYKNQILQIANNPAKRDPHGSNPDEVGKLPWDK